MDYCALGAYGTLVLGRGRQSALRLGSGPLLADILERSQKFVAWRDLGVMQHSEWNITPRRGGGLVFNHVELVPVGIREPESGPPVLLLDRPRDLDPVLAKPRLLPRGVLRGEKESGVSLLRA